MPLRSKVSGIVIPASSKRHEEPVHQALLEVGAILAMKVFSAEATAGDEDWGTGWGRR